MFGTKQPQEPTVIVIFGGSGDLNKRKLTPALYNLYLDKYLPEKFAIIGSGRTEYSDEDFRKIMQEGVDEFSRRGKVKNSAWDKFAKHIFYRSANVKDADSFQNISAQIEAMEKEWGEKSNRLFYLSVAPTLFETIAVNLGKSQVCEDIKRARIVIEKPFGHDLKSAKALNKLLGTIFHESQIFRIDHYLGKETVQNILTTRFTNAVFEPLWNRNYIDHVQITVSETVGVEGRGEYYEGSGALRDMVQNHMLQLVSMIAMEPPISTDADEVRNKKVDVIKAMRRYKPEEVDEYAVRGQYGPGWIKGKEVPGYREEEGVDPHSNTETYAAAKFFVDTWRWQDVPFYVRTGKHMADKTSVITIQLRPAPHRAFSVDGDAMEEANRIIINIQPEMGITIRFQAKRPGMNQIVNPVDMVFDYDKSYDAQAPEAYEALLLDAISGNAALFMRADQVEAAWEVVMPILESWGNKPIENYPSYASGTWGPPEADRLLAKEGHSWINPPASNAKETIIKDKHDESRKGVVNLHVYENTDDLSYCAAELFVHKSKEAIERDGRFVVALSGGNSSKKLYELLTQRPFVTEVAWSKVHVFWGDERAVAIDDPESNAGMAFKTMLDEVQIPKEQIHPMQGDTRPDLAARQYEETLQDFFRGRSPRFDLILLGLGDDAHTASLFPGVQISDKRMSWVQDVFVPKLDAHRITLTPQLINQSHAIAFIAYGDKKAAALQHVLEDDYHPSEYPAQTIKLEDGEVHWFVDNEAAASLKDYSAAEAS